MYSPISPRRGFRASRNTVRRNLLSPSQATPFSHSTEALNIINSSDHDSRSHTSPINRSSSFSQPRTPTEGSGRFPGGNFRSNLSFGSGSVGSVTPGGRTVKEYDEGMRELKKENFNLKLRIYFLEERLGTRSNLLHEDKDQLLKSNTDLKIQVESLKHDVKEKTELLLEAGQALEQLENKLSVMSIEREDEKQLLESRLAQMELDLHNPEHYHHLSNLSDNERKSSVPSSDGSNRDEDEKLIKEVDAEMARKVKESFEPSLDHSLNRSRILSVLEEKEEVETLACRLEEIETVNKEMTKLLEDAEEELLKAREDIQMKIQDIVTLESEGVSKDMKISSLQGDVTNLEEESCKNRQDITSLEARIDRLNEDLKKTCAEKTEILLLLDEKENIIQELSSKLLESKKSQVGIVVPDCPIMASPSNFSMHTHQLLDNQQDQKRFQIVTQSLSIPPNEDQEVHGQLEVEKLRSDMKHLRDYLRTSGQERTLLLRRIGTLHDRISEKNQEILVKSCQQHFNFNGRCLLLKIAALQQKLSASQDNLGQIREEIQVIVKNIQPYAKAGKVPDDILDSLQSLLDKNPHVQGDSRVATPLMLERTEQKEESESESSSGWMNVLPDPSNLDLPVLEKSRLTGAEEDPIAILQQQLEEKDKVIQEQDSLLDEFRLEIIRLQDNSATSCHTIPRRIKGMRKKILASTPSLINPNPKGHPNEDLEGPSNRPLAKALSDGEDSWSEPDITASRKRMGLPLSFLASRDHPGGQLEKDSSETDVEKPQMSFYALDYTSTNSNQEIPDFQCESADYSKIIQELKSHRREIEKLQNDLIISPSSHAAAVAPGHVCNSRIPGSLDCLLEGISNLYHAMDTLAYQLNLSETLDSGNGTEVDDEDIRLLSKGEISLTMCKSCSQIVCKDLEHCLQRSCHLIISSSKAISRLRQQCCSLKSKYFQSREDIAKQESILSQQERNFCDINSQLSEARNELETLRFELNQNNQELNESQTKLNENYKLVAELSNENLRLTGEKVKLEELLALTKSKKNFEAIEFDSDQQPKVKPGVESHGTQPYSGSRCSACSMRKENRHYNHSNRGGRFKGRYYRNKQGINEQHHYQDHRKNPLSGPTAGPGTGLSTASGQVDISSPDLGVDLGSSDPFSSLERSNADLSSNPGATSIDSAPEEIFQENNILRQERDFLMQKLIRSKSALKETLNRMSSTASSSAVDPKLTPLPPKKNISSTTLLRAVGSSPSRSKVTQDLIEFSHSQKSRNGRNYHKSRNRAKNHEQS